MYDCLDQFSFSIHRVAVQAVDVLDLPGFKGSTIHGAFGHALQKISTCAGHEMIIIDDRPEESR
jgi:hypothetical protein